MLVQIIKEKVCRVVVYENDENYGTGSGFFVASKKLITCFHVAFRKELKFLRLLPIFQNIEAKNEHSKLEEYHRQYVVKTEIEDSEGKILPAILHSFNEKYDFAVFEIATEVSADKICDMDTLIRLNYGDRVYFGGYPTQADYQAKDFPFALHEGLVSSFVNAAIGGDKYEHLQIHSINLGGNSGAPLFKADSDKVVGIINGNMNFGNDNVLLQDLSTQSTIIGSVRIPIPVAYATPLSLLKKEGLLDFLSKRKLS